jgi:hypothetical protein
MPHDAKVQGSHNIGGRERAAWVPAAGLGNHGNNITSEFAGGVFQVVNVVCHTYKILQETLMIITGKRIWNYYRLPQIKMSILNRRLLNIN